MHALSRHRSDTNIGIEIYDNMFYKPLWDTRKIIDDSCMIFFLDLQKWAKGFHDNNCPKLIDVDI